MERRFTQISFDPKALDQNDVTKLAKQAKLRKTPSIPPQSQDNTGKLRNRVHFSPASSPAVPTHHAAAGPREFLETQPGSPWEHYREAFTWHDLGGDALLAVKMSPEKRVNIRAFPEDQAEQALFWFRQVRHCSFVAALEAFATEKLLYVVLEEMDITLSHVIRCSRYPDKQELGAILGQILDGLVYLEQEGFEHTSLGWDTVLLNQAGEVKIGNQECCRTATTDSRSRGVRRVGGITRGLMNKDEKPIGVQRQQWLSCPEAINFVAATITAKSAKELLEHPFLTLYGRKDGKWHKGSLLGLVSLAMTEADRKYRYKLATE
ncbi:uncharacterized protein B0T15DRAFT_537725 [Chaetomium strumarium]|uniref:Protein kinase domain-containing protein n=1 Tax=Chaetomium strumarium TaxID=1170767 RepID=A0AAJ0M0X9_9PEZI|nr:hypothetical protein B0T15DRAFT_537725 [Chaetomium strumarium]